MFAILGRPQLQIKEDKMQVVNSAQKSSKPNKNLSLPFTTKIFINDEVNHTESLQVSLWEDMENREYPERKVLVSNLIHD